MIKTKQIQQSYLTIIHLFSVTLLALSLSACEQQQQTDYEPRFSDQARQDKTVYIFSIHPLHNPTRLFEVYQPLIDYLETHLLSTRFKLEASRNYAAYDEKLFSGKFHFSLPNPYQTVMAAERGYQVFGKMGDDDNFRGIILVRKDSGIQQVSDLKNQAVSYPAPTALAATMLPQWYLYSHGLNILEDIENRYVGSQESSIMNVYLKQTLAGATWPPPWRAFAKERPEVAQALEIKWQTQPLPNNGLVVRKDVPQALVDAVGSLLFQLHTHETGRQILATMELSRFEAANYATYQPVREFLKKFEQQVRPIRE
ncbi:phosphate/phosphite/phosphonate ABC transporter substrate-binding protein [Candidatus Venteria ishoeyi]|uniref:ABC transporter, phosphonate, periplasmic substrate-binding protein n=1 Tax=Candidatus Venteria ishoeyi TaxID=1899563 RepID=A0A1H6F5Z2_9GAMM|nr:PhnD/SsuA/transferrin family substrate-binding protein [Candidatus Venteria ishoeyi]SEH04405.1 ABC transporter%2C phosphonate%2C periplasmic substrate-binding protein [Candidatus Venteria ishoeyi]